MKVYIGKYKSWIGPFQIANRIPFLSEDTQWKIGEWLSNTWVNDLCEWIHRKTPERKIKVRIDRYDTWSMDNTLAHIILPMLKQLKETKHGSPYVDNEDVPAHMRHTLSKGPDDYETEDRWIHYKWEWILNEMIWTFEQELTDDWEAQFRHGEPEIDWELVSGKEGDEDAMYKMNRIDNDYWVDYDKIREYNDRIDNGFRLFGKYYRNLWD
jgi:hypothetical protein